MLPDTERFRLIGGPYRPPKCRIGGTLSCAIRGEVRVVGMTDGPIPWPTTRSERGGTASIILCGDLVKAVKRESAQAVGHWFGVKANTVWIWRKALGVDQNNVGTRKLRSKWWNEGGVDEASRPGREATYHSPERAAKIAAAKRGKPRPIEVVEKMRRASMGRKHKTETRRKMSEAQRARGAYPPAAGRPFSAAEDTLLGTMLDRELAAKLGRSAATIAGRRLRLGIRSYRKHEK